MDTNEAATMDTDGLPVANADAPENMTTLEKLFVQIFERKNMIIEQVKQQTDLYNQHLASKLLIDGITPPPWLWNPNSNSLSFDPKELKKEELISELLLPRPPPPVCYPGTHSYLHNKSIGIGDDKELSERFFMETNASNKGLLMGDRPTTIPEGRDNDTGCSLNCVPEFDISSTSPQQKIEVGSSNLYTAPDQSILNIQRSKLRQKALELRNSAKAASKSCFMDENDACAPSRGFKTSRIASQNLDRDKELIELATFSHVISDNGAVRLTNGEYPSKEKDADIYCGRITRSRSSCNSSRRDRKPLKLLNSLDTAMEIGDRTTGSQSNCIGGLSENYIGMSAPLHLSNSASQRLTRSKSSTSKKSLLANSLNRLEGFVPQNMSHPEVNPCPDIDAVVNQEGNADYITKNKLIADKSVEARAACFDSNFDAAGLSLGMEVSVSRPPSDCSMFMEPKTLDFGDVEKCSLNETSDPMIAKIVLGKSSENRCCASVKSDASLGKIIFDYPSRKSLENQSPEQEVSKKTAEARRVSFESGREECVEVDEEAPKLDTNKKHNNIEDNSDAVVEIQHCPVSHEADAVLSTVDIGPDIEMCQKVKCCRTEGLKSSPKLQVEEGELGCFGKDRSETTPFMIKHQQLVPSSLVSSWTKQQTGDQGCLVREAGMTDPSSVVVDVRQCHVEENQDLMRVESKLDTGNIGGLAFNERTLQERKSYAAEDSLLARGSVGSLRSKDTNFSFSRMIDQFLEKSLLPGRRSRFAMEDSWPQFKRRKIEDQQTNFFSASPSFRAKEIHSIGGHTMNGCLKSFGDNLESVLQFPSFPVSREGDVVQSNAGKSPNVKMHQIVKYFLTPGIEPSTVQQLEQDEIGYEWRNESTHSPSTSKHGKLGTSFVSSLTKEAAGDCHSCSTDHEEPVDTTSIVLDVKQSDEQNYETSLHSEDNVSMENQDDLTHKKSILMETKAHFEDNCLYPYRAAVSPQNEHLVSIGSEHSMPELEGFIMDTEENEQPHILGDEISLDKLNLPSTTIERVSVLERLCKSASLHTPLPQFSATFKLHDTPDAYQSVPNGLLEHMDLRSALNLNSDDGKQLIDSYSCADEVNGAFQGVSYSGYVPYADPCYGWSSRIPHLSPVGKLWDRISSKSISSEKQRSMNPELTCFPIEEDPSTSGENENRGEVAGTNQTSQEDISSKVMSCGAKREHLAELTDTCVDPATSVSAVERFPDRSSFDSVNTDISFNGTCSMVKEKHGNLSTKKRRCTNGAKGNQTSSVSTNCVKKANEPLKNRFSKPKLSGKTSLRNGGQSLSEESKPNNIVSNISSFVPLIQQKQAAAVVTGKRNIKVRALDAAEAAKRVEEKRQNERKMKKEALKLERTRIGQENLRQMEIKKKKKEEDQKKKDIDMAGRKRLRVEEGRMEMEKKRKRFEDCQRRQREQEDKLRVRKAEKENEKVNNGKESNGEFRKHQKMEKGKGTNNILKKPQIESRTVSSNVGQAVEDGGAISHCRDYAEPTSVLPKTTENDGFMAKTSQEKSYEISPYQCSDDEEEKEDEIPTRKFIPSWASKNSLAAAVSSQQKVDPDIIFPPESFCSMDEVLQPRKLQLK